MSGLAAGGLGILALVILMAARVPIGVAMLVTGLGGYAAMVGWTAPIAYLKTAAYWRFSAYELSVVPLFFLMGQFAVKAGISRSLFEACNAFLGHRRGGLAMASVGACGAFGAICGSSLATASTMARVALPEMRRAGYANSLATGALAAGGTLGILIPPSVVLVIYAVLAEQNIVKMFAAAIIPGLLALAGYMLAIALTVRFNPKSAPARSPATANERRQALRRVWPVALIFALVIGGIYAGWFTPTEAAAIGAMATGLFAVFAGGMRLVGLGQCLLATAETTAMIFLILLGADLFNVFLALTQLPADAARWAAASGAPALVLLGAMLLLYLALGCVMDSLSMILLTVPVFLPLVLGLDFGLSAEDSAIWFGVLTLVVVEVGLITPPVGMNVFIINAIAGDIPLHESFRGIVPFLISDLVRVVFLVAFPGLSLWLVGAVG